MAAFSSSSFSVSAFSTAAFDFGATPPSPSTGGGGGGSLKHRKSLKELVREWFALVAEEKAAPVSRAAAVAIVKPFIRESTVDWVALEADSEAARALVTAYVRDMKRSADIEEEDEMIVLLH